MNRISLIVIGVIVFVAIFGVVKDSQNSVLFDCVNCEGEDIELYFFGIDTIDLGVQNGNKSMPNWYGKDHIGLVFLGKTHIISLNQFKFDARKKVKGAIKVVFKDDSVNVFYKLESGNLVNVEKINLRSTLPSTLPNDTSATVQ